MASDPRDYHVDISGMAGEGNGGEARAMPRPFLSVHFACCGVYQRIYRAASGDSYIGRCPRCQRQVKFLVGEEGTTSRFFRVE